MTIILQGAFVFQTPMMEEEALVQIFYWSNWVPLVMKVIPFQLLSLQTSVPTGTVGMQITPLQMVEQEFIIQLGTLKKYPPLMATLQLHPGDRLEDLTGNCLGLQMPMDME